MDFRQATDELFAPISHEALAERLRVSVASIRQARLNPDALAHRSPPKRWESAVVGLAEQQIARYQHLVAELRRATIEPGKPKRGKPITD